jgi:predicted dehydrogenase
VFTEKIETKVGWTFPQPDEDQEIQDFVEAWRTDASRSGAALALEVTAVIYAAYLSAAEGRRVDLRPFLR